MNQTKPILLLLLALLGLTHQANSQVGPERTRWVFGKNAQINFDDNGIIGVSTHPLDAYQGSACYSNKKGELILATNGNAVYGKNNQLMGLITGEVATLGTAGQIIIPQDSNETKFYIFIIDNQRNVRYAKVDIEGNNGNGVLSVSSTVLLNSSAVDFTAVKHCFSEAYWLVCSNSQDVFYSFLVKPNSIEAPVISKVGGIRNQTGDFVSNHAGNKIAVSNYSENWVEVYDFDKRCGSISNAERLSSPGSLGQDHPDGMTFSPDDRSLYVAWSYANSMLIQYEVANLGKGFYNSYSSSENINDIALGIDGNLYLNVHQNQIPSRRIHQLKSVNVIAGGGTRVIEDVVTLPAGTNGSFEFPNFISNKTGGSCNGAPGADNQIIAVDSNRCTDKLVRFNADWTTNVCDSIRWDFDDPIAPDNHSNQTQIERSFPEPRLYKVKCYLYYCQFVDTVNIDINMVAPPLFDLGSDTTICYGTEIGIGVEINADTLIWSDGATGFIRNAEPGTYQATAIKGRCEVTDEISIFSYPEIWTELDGEYYICDLENETTVLDAGAGFKKYKWTPTGDTTQWIIVQEIGEYIVIVDAFTGCLGTGNTVVKRICDLQVFVPNAFSPNDDGLNEVFRATGEFILKQQLKIYNLWGELIFSDAGANVSWDGSEAPSGNYFYTLEVEGFQNKLPVTKHLKGVVMLSR